MDVLDSVLRSAGAEKYVDIFKKHMIEASTLPLLNNDDLKLIGVDNETIRNAILQRASNLQIPQEKRSDLIITKEYAASVLSNLSQQLYLHHASLSCALQRKDVIVCNVKLHKATQCLLNRIDALDHQLNQFTEKVGLTAVCSRKKMKRKKCLKIIGLSSVALLLLINIVRIVKTY